MAKAPKKTKTDIEQEKHDKANAEARDASTEEMHNDLEQARARRNKADALKYG